MAKLNPQKEQKQNQSLNTFATVETMRDEEWIEMNEVQVDCGRFGHFSEVTMNWYDRDEKNKIVCDKNDKIIWYRKYFKGICVQCSARRKGAR